MTLITGAKSALKGFTLIELLVVLTVIILLSSLGYFGLSGFREGHVLSASRDEAMFVFENARSQAVTNGRQRTVQFDSAASPPTFLIQDETGTATTDTIKLESGVTIAGPAQVVFQGTGSIQDGATKTYTFTGQRSGKVLTLIIYPKTGRVEKT